MTICLTLVITSLHPKSNSHTLYCYQTLLFLVQTVSVENVMMMTTINYYYISFLTCFYYLFAACFYNEIKQPDWRGYGISWLKLYNQSLLVSKRKKIPFTFVWSLMFLAKVIDTCTLAIRQNQNETIESVRSSHIAGVNNENEIFS